MKRKFKLAYLVSHPIQYQAPLLREISEDHEIDLTVFFCSSSSVQRHFDKGFGRDIEWDVPLLGGYKHKFLWAYRDKGDPGVFHPLNKGLSKILKEENFDALWVHGHMRFYHLLSMIKARINGLIVLNRDEAWKFSARRQPVKVFAKRLFYVLLRRVCHGWLVIGSANRDYYLCNGMQKDKIFFVPYSIDNKYFRDRALAAIPKRAKLREKLFLEPNRQVILYAAKLLTRKRPNDLIEAFSRLLKNKQIRAPYLVLVGDGNYRKTLERQVKLLDIETSVRFVGFINQSEIPGYYDLCDVFVLPSVLEPWGLVINEVMTAGRAIIASDQVGSAQDLVKQGENGFVFPAGDLVALTKSLERIITDKKLSQSMGKRSLEIIENWDFRKDIEGLKACLRHFLG